MRGRAAPGNQAADLRAQPLWTDGGFACAMWLAALLMAVAFGSVIWSSIAASAARPQLRAPHPSDGRFDQCRSKS